MSFARTILQKWAFMLFLIILISIPHSYLVSFTNVKADCSLQLTKADWTEIQGPSIRLLQVIGALHDTGQPLAVFKSKYMPNLMGQCLKGYI